MNECILKSKTYFAAANGYYGFRSNFDKIFSPERIDKLFVIKGGPGTGKSTMMKKIAKEFCDKAKIINILCSSDPSSLDGLILSKNGVSIAIADGTSPHAIEPTYPGAFEEIVNLGEGFDFDELRKNKDEIIRISHNKKTEYNKAYSLLSVAGDLYKYISIHFLNIDIYNLAESLAKKTISDDNECRYTSVDEDYLVGAFSKDGYKRLSLETEKSLEIRIKGDGISEYLLMSKIHEILAKEKLIKRIYPSAFSGDLCDAIETDSTIFLICYDDVEAVDSSLLLLTSDEYKSIKTVYDSVIEKSRQCFKCASTYHFLLEDIYSQNISFEKNEITYERIIEEIYNLFSK